MESLVLTYTQSDVLQKVVEKDEQGWYKVNLGAINAYNAHGHFYLSEGVRELLYDPASRFAQKIEKGYLIGEMEHPKLTSDMDEMDVFLRITNPDRDRQSHHIKKIEIIDTGKPTGGAFPGNILQLVGYVKPAGPFGHLLEQSLNDPEINTCFSIRALTENKRINGTLVKQIKTIVTFDWVTEPGIPSANKFDTERISVESFDLPYKFTPEKLKKFQEVFSKKFDGMESNSLEIIDELRAKEKKEMRIFKW